MKVAMSIFLLLSICMLSNPVIAHLSRASGVRGRGFVGVRSKSKKKKVLMKIMEMRDRADFKDLPVAA